MMLGVIQLLKKNIDGVFFMKSGAIFGYPVCQLLRMRTTFGSYFHCLVCGWTKFAKFVLGCLSLFLVSIDGSKQVSWIFGISQATFCTDLWGIVVFDVR